MLQDLKISQKYALALFKACEKAKSIKAVTADLVCLKEAWNQSAKLIEFINSPIHNSNTRTQLLDTISKKLHLHSNIKNLLCILAINRRLNLLVLIVNDYLKLYRDANNEQLVKITTTHKLSVDQSTTIKKSLELQLDKKIIIKNIIDESILGGIIIQIDSFVIDNSTSNKLNNIQLLINNKFKESS
jgi:F-type H+-transporting ATPase subunit delta